MVSCYFDYDMYTCFSPLFSLVLWILRCLDTLNYVVRLCCAAMFVDVWAWCGLAPFEPMAREVHWAADAASDQLDRGLGL
mmetsp:Transcript_3344/g.6363  ORF Transcript_3344/g.6363 Transcript_3344/m.6363 type:complete len:80 (-) Transcript_3344:4196-4435(-)